MAFSTNWPKGKRFEKPSDQDQNNPKNNSFSGKRLLALFQEIGALPIAAQKEAITSSLSEHNGGMDQRDDILVIGVRL